ncbi:5-dehydro-4-deoxyglucarate dehydratase [Methylobacterium nonmethylotrophicum]|uniref:Probable 5-dehydro-4-deoxyglucarate dehydratase n=1 Tax=Methylobacterium nonmethylotrophicum TaxID=1141884 RepID=A0A4Z0NGN4_9HYPH|nr:5-dehydro-4-deoxyglucarate dehydratase [Methylobacterium nonmethylotrophicum]TGD94623.1 5-dehydro-4-deoxyglucarate dehydratase [Methylobacterium nonmethylotrophicum]
MPSALSPVDLARRLGAGLLSFPVTPFTADFAIDEAQYRSNLDWLCGYDVAGLFAAGGTGEFFSLTPAEVARVVGIAVAGTNGRVPVLAGAGYGTAIACEMARAAEAAGADGLLLLPPYLVGSEQEGLSAHIEAVCRATGLGVIVYNRDNAVIGPDALARLCERLPNLVGYKDGIGDIELMTRVYSRLGDRLTYIGGLPTAETFALPYLEMGVTTYSSAVFNFVPDFALDFYAAVRRRDRVAVAQGLRDFILPLIEIRNRRKGYAVSVIKAGMRAVGRDSGPVRSPLTDLAAAEQAELAALVARVVPAQALAAESS